MSPDLSIEEVRDELISLPEFDRGNVHRIVSRLKVDASDLRRYIQWGDECYTRTRFHEDDRFQMLVLAWAPGQISPIHDHCESICSMHVVAGECESVTFRHPEGGGGPLEKDPPMILGKGSTTTVYGGDIHTLGCREGASEGLVTLHFYLPVIPHMLLFDEATGRATRVTSKTLDPLPPDSFWRKLPRLCNRSKSHLRGGQGGCVMTPLRRSSD